MDKSSLFAIKIKKDEFDVVAQLYLISFYNLRDERKRRTPDQKNVSKLIGERQDPLEVVQSAKMLVQYTEEIKTYNLRLDQLEGEIDQLEGEIDQLGGEI